MGLRITSDQITSTITDHFASLVSSNGSAEQWRVSWLPDRTLDRNQAITALTLAENLVDPPLDAHDHLSAFVHVWAEELSLTGADALVLVLTLPTNASTTATHDHCPCTPPNSACPLPRHRVRVTKPFHRYTSADWADYYRWAAHWLSADADRHEAACTYPTEVIGAWRETVVRLERDAGIKAVEAAPQ